MAEPGLEPDKSTSKTPKSRVPNNTGVFFVCLGIAFVLWLVVRLSSVYVGTIPAFIRYTNMPENKVSVQPLEKKVKLRVETPGYKLLLTQMGFNKIYLDIDLQETRHKQFLLTDDLRKRVAENLPLDVRLFSISPDTLYLNFDEKYSRRIPVRLVKKLEFEKQFDQKELIQLSPDSVEVSGPKILIDSIKSWPTVELKQKRVKDNLRGTIDLVKPARNGISISPETVKYNIVVEEFTEQSIEVEVRKMNVPAGMQITTYPKKVKVTFQVPLNNYEAINETSFEVVADFGKIEIGKQKEVYLELTQTPAYVKGVTISPISTEYIIYK